MLTLVHHRSSSKLRSPDPCDHGNSQPLYHSRWHCTHGSALRGDCSLWSRLSHCTPSSANLEYTSARYDQSSLTLPVCFNESHHFHLAHAQPAYSQLISNDISSHILGRTPLSFTYTLMLDVVTTIHHHQSTSDAKQPPTTLNDRQSIAPHLITPKRPHQLTPNAKQRNTNASFVFSSSLSLPLLCTFALP